MKSGIRPTIAYLARKTEVSIASVSRVLNGTAPVNDATAARVRSAIADLNYIPHATARALASRRTNTLGLMIPEISSAFFQPLLRGVESGTSEAGHDFLVRSTRNPNLGSVPRRPLANITLMVCLFSNSVTKRELNHLSNIGFPVILFHQTPPKTLNIPFVTIENRSGAQGLGEHLITVHHRHRISFLRGPDGQENSTLREKGYHDALKAHGLTFDPALVKSGGFNRDEARVTVERVLFEKLFFDAIFCGDYYSSIGAIQALRQAGKRIPEDIPLAGFDDQVFASTTSPPLTSVYAPTEKVGQNAVRMLVYMIRGENITPRLVLPTQLVIRESCGCNREIQRRRLD